MSNLIDPSSMWRLLLADTTEQINASHLRDAVEQMGLLRHDNNYLNGVTGSGNGIVTFAREGLSSLTFDASHRHAAADITDLNAVLDARYVRRDQAASLDKPLSLTAGLKIGEGSGRYADLFYREGRMVISADVYLTGRLDGPYIGKGFDESTMWESLGTTILEKKIPAKYLSVESGGGSSDMAATLGNAGGKYNIGTADLPTYFKEGLPVAITNLLLPEGTVSAKTVKVGKVELTTDENDNLVIKGNTYTTGWMAIGGEGEEGGGGGSYVLPAATATRLGGVMIGDGITVDAAGRISVPGGGGGLTWADLRSDTDDSEKEISGKRLRLSSDGSIYADEFGYLHSAGGGGGGNVSASATLTLDRIILGDNSKTVKASIYTIDNDVTNDSSKIPTAWAVKAYVDAHSGGGGDGISKEYADTLYLSKTSPDTSAGKITFTSGIRIGTAANGVDITFDSASGAIKIDGKAFTTDWFALGGPQ